jgi:hypothetical protein
MGVYEARGMLAKAWKDLSLRWLDTKVSWDDSVAHRFENDFLLPMEQDMRNCMAAMDHVATILAQVRRDCE